MKNTTIDYDYIFTAVIRLFPGVTTEQKKAIIKILCMYEELKVKTEGRR